MLTLEGLRKSAYAGGARAVAPLAIVIGILGLLLGFLSRQAGLSFASAVVMSGTTFAGSPQFVALSLFQQGADILVASAAAGSVALRFGVMGLTTAAELPGKLPMRLLLSQLVVDESWAVSYAGKGRFDAQRLIGAGVLLYVVHVSSTAVGALSGALIGDPNVWGLDAAFPALFVLLLWPHLGAAEARFSAVIAGVIVLVLTPVTPPGIPITAAACAALVGKRS